MTRKLVAICVQCQKSVATMDVRFTSANRIASLVRDAQQAGWDIRLADDDFPVGCDCPQENAIVGTPSNRAPANPRRLKIRQLLYIMTVVAVLLAIFRRPIQLMFDPVVWQAVVSPWSVYAWLFWNGEMTRPPDLKSSPMAAIAFTISTPLAVLTGYFALMGLGRGIARLWNQISRDD